MTFEWYYRTVLHLLSESRNARLVFQEVSARSPVQNKEMIHAVSSRLTTGEFLKPQDQLPKMIRDSKRCMNHAACRENMDEAMLLSVPDHYSKAPKTKTKAFYVYDKNTITAHARAPPARRAPSRSRHLCRTPPPQAAPPPPPSRTSRGVPA